MVRLCEYVPQGPVVATMFLLALTVLFIDRMTFDLAVSVVSQKEHQENKRENGTCPLCPHYKKKNFFPNLKTEFYWTAFERAKLSTGFFIGYIITLLSGGFLSDRCGPKRVMGVGIFISGVCVLLTPLCATLTRTVWVLLINRIVMGLAQGPMLPSLSTFIARWVIPGERNIMCAYLHISISSGPISSILVTKFILGHSKTWDALFYYVGSFSVLFSLAWFPLTHDTPKDHPCITDEELDKINDGLQDEISDQHSNLPIAALLKSLPAWAMVIAYIGHDGIYYVLTSLVPLYMDYFLRIEVMDYGLISCFPYIALAVISVSSALLADFVLRRGFLSKTNQCKIWLVFANVVPGVFVLVSSFAGCDGVTAVSLFILAAAFVGFCSSSIWIVNVNMAPNFAGQLMGLMNGMGCFFSLAGPRLEAVVLEHGVEAWKLTFLVHFLLVTAATVFFVVFGSADLQPWNDPSASLPWFWSGIRPDRSVDSSATSR